MTLSDLLSRRPDLKRYARLFRDLHAFHGESLEHAFETNNEAWAADIHESTPRTEVRDSASA